MRDQWILNPSGGLEVFSRSPLAAAFASVPGYGGAMERAGGAIERDCQSPPDRWNNSHCRGTLVRSSRYRTQGTQNKISFAGLAHEEKSQKTEIFRGLHLRVVDESGEDFGYSADRFFRLEVPRPLERALLRSSP